MSENRNGIGGKTSCNFCDRKFIHKKNLYRHMRKVHPDQEIEYEIKTQTICCICDTKFSKLPGLYEHLRVAHPDVELSYERKFFSSMKDFVEWKKKIEKETLSFFRIRHSEMKLADGRTSTFYCCNRSGIYKPAGCGKRRMKHIGTHKIGKTCPAYLTMFKATENGATKIEVEYQSKHVGHKHEIERVHLIPGRCRQKRHKKHMDDLDDDDAASLDLKVKQLMTEEGNPVLLYKPINDTLKEYPGINSCDFLLIIMSDVQCKLLQIYGEKGVIIDSTHGTNQYRYELTTLMVNDLNHEGFPVAVMYSSRRTADFFFAFFSEIKKKVDYLQPRVFMSNDSNVFYKAWKMVFGEVTQHLLSAWHVNRSWSTNLRSKVKIPELQAVLIRELEQLLKEPDVGAFKEMAVSMVDKLLSNEKTRSFGEYFVSRYMKRTEQWALCYRHDCQMSSDVKLDGWHHELRYEEAGSKIIKRLDKSLGIILRAIAKQLIWRIISVEQSQLTSRISKIKKCHDDSTKLCINDVVEVHPQTFWIVPCSQTANTYEVSYEKDCDCELRCHICNICIHQFSCTCNDYTIRFIICKHIHLICSHFQVGFCSSSFEVNTEGSFWVDDSMVIDIRDIEASSSVCQKSETVYSLSIEEQKAALNVEFRRLMDQCQKSSQLQIVKEMIDQVKAKLQCATECSIFSNSRRLTNQPMITYIIAAKQPTSI